MKNLKTISQEIRDIIDNKQKELELSFTEAEHIYFMKDKDGIVKNNFPSVSKLLKHFYEPFPAEDIAYKKAKGDRVEMERLLDEWSAAGSYATNMGSRAHFILEKKTIDMYGGYKEVRKPLFECDIEQELRSNSMINAGEKFLKLMDERGAYLLDTEMVLGHPDLGYTGQPDKVWLIMNKEKNGFGLVITDWKTNKEKNFKKTHWTKPMKTPFQDLPDNALGHYQLQLPFYGRLILKMLEGSKYENISLLGCVIVLLKGDSEFEEFKIPSKTINKVMNLKLSDYGI